MQRGVAAALRLASLARSSGLETGLPALSQLRTWCQPHGSAVAGLHTTPSMLALEIMVPSMGDSITEGTIATILRAEGEVEEDEPILQIETDKVTIDVRAPTAGVLRVILVKEDEVVVVGQVVAVLEEGDGRTSAETPDPNAKPSKAGSYGQEVPTPQRSPGPASTSKPAQSTSWDELAVAASEKSDSTYRKASIKFPPRRTPEGHMISAMPAVDQSKYINRSTAKQVNQAPAKPSRYVTSADPVPRRTLSEREMESIMLGGAEW